MKRMMWTGVIVMAGCVWAADGVRPQTSGDIRVLNPYEDVKWDKVEYLHSFSHQHLRSDTNRKAWEMGYRHLPASNYYPAKPAYPLPGAFARKHPDAIGAPNAEQTCMIDSPLHFNALGSFYSTGYGKIPSFKADTSPIEHVFTGLNVLDTNTPLWRCVYRLDLRFAQKEGAGVQTAVSLTVEGGINVGWKTFEPVGNGIVRSRPLSVTSKYQFLLKTQSENMRVRISFDPATTKITRFRLMQGVNRPWRDAFRAALDGTRKDAQGKPVEGLLFPDAGGITINHPWLTLEDLLAMLDFDERVLGIEIWNPSSLFGYFSRVSPPPTTLDELTFYNHWDNVLRTGRRCFGFFVKDHPICERGRNVLLVSDLSKLTRQEREHEALLAYRQGRFFGLIGAMSIDASGKVVSPYDKSDFRFTRIAVRQDKNGKPVGLEVAVDGADRAKRPNTQIRFVTDQGIAGVESGDKVFFAFPRAADGSILCRYVRVEAFAYPATHLDGKPLTAEALSAMNVLQIARIHDRLGDILPAKIDDIKGQAPIGIVDMIFAQPILIRH